MRSGKARPGSKSPDTCAQQIPSDVTCSELKPPALPAQVPPPLTHLLAVKVHQHEAGCRRGLTGAGCGHAEGAGGGAGVESQAGAGLASLCRRVRVQKLRSMHKGKKHAGQCVQRVRRRERMCVYVVNRLLGTSPCADAAGERACVPAGAVRQVTSVTAVLRRVARCPPLQATTSLL